MWFTLGLVTLGVVLWWQVHFRWVRPWTGHVPSVSDESARQRFLNNKSGAVGLQIGYEVPTYFRFELKRESWVDRFFKWVGLSVEKQFGELKFDRLVYVASNDQHLINRLADSADMRKAAMAAFEAESYECRVRRIVCANGWLRADLKRRNLLNRKDDALRLSRCGDRVLPRLLQMSELLRAAPPPANTAPERDPYLFRAIVLLAISTAMTIHGTLFLFRPWLFGDVFMVDPWRIAELALICGAVIVALLVLANFVLLARSARGHLILLELLIVGSFGAVMFSAAELREANIEWDRSLPQVLETQVIGKHVSKSRRSGTTYFVHVKDWDDTFDERRIQVSPSFYSVVQPGYKLVIEQHAGYLGARWARIQGYKSLSSD